MTVSAIHCVIDQFSCCFHDVEAWVNGSQLHLNASQLQVLWLGSRHIANKLCVISGRLLTMADQCIDHVVCSLLFSVSIWDSDRFNQYCGHRQCIPQRYISPGVIHRPFYTELHRNVTHSYWPMSCSVSFSFDADSHLSLHQLLLCLSLYQLMLFLIFFLLSEIASDTSVAGNLWIFWCKQPWPRSDVWWRIKAGGSARK